MRQNYRERCLTHCYYKLSLSNSYFVRRRLSLLQFAILVGPVKTMFAISSRSHTFRWFMLKALLRATVYFELMSKVHSQIIARYVQEGMSKYLKTNQHEDLLDIVRMIEHFELWDNYFQDICVLLQNDLKQSPEGCWEVAMKVFNELALWGNYLIGEKILLTVRESIDFKNPGTLWYEKGLYFSAIGHQAQLHWLIQCLVYFNSAHLAALGSEYSKPASEILAKKWVDLAHQEYLMVNPIKRREMFGYLDLETFPTGKGYGIIRRNLGKAQLELNLTNNRKFLSLTDNEISEAEAILASFGFRSSEFCQIVGLHVRIGSDLLREGRNSSIAKYESLLKNVSRRGDWVISIGDQSQGVVFREFENKGLNFINFAISNTRERELVHLYVWAKSRFMVGNLSGGTMPAMGFGVPILWVDIYPLRHFRPPNENDIIIPKRLINEIEGKNICFDEIFSEAGHFYDSENILLLHSRGLQLVATDEIDILSGVEEMYFQLGRGESLSPDTEVEKRVNQLYASVNLTYGARWSQAFISRHSDFFTGSN